MTLLRLSRDVSFTSSRGNFVNCLWLVVSLQSVLPNTLNERLPSSRRTSSYKSWNVGSHWERVNVTNTKGTSWHWTLERRGVERVCMVDQYTLISFSFTIRVKYRLLWLKTTGQCQSNLDALKRHEPLHRKTKAFRPVSLEEGVGVRRTLAT